MMPWTRYRRMRAALQHIGGDGCKFFIHPGRWSARTSCTDFPPGQWCDACVANEALGR